MNNDLELSFWLHGHKITASLTTLGDDLAGIAIVWNRIPKRTGKKFKAEYEIARDSAAKTLLNALRRNGDKNERAIMFIDHFNREQFLSVIPKGETALSDRYFDFDEVVFATL